MNKSTGILKYYNTWALLIVDKEIPKYYRNLYWLSVYKVRQLNPGKREPHITVVAGDYEVPACPEFWRKYDGTTIDFAYDSCDNRDGMYWLPVYCPRLTDIRIELGLKPQLKFPFHLTIGHLHLDEDSFLGY